VPEAIKSPRGGGPLVALETRWEARFGRFVRTTGVPLRPSRAWPKTGSRGHTMTLNIFGFRTFRHDDRGCGQSGLEHRSWTAHRCRAARGEDHLAGRRCHLADAIDHLRRHVTQSQPNCSPTPRRSLGSTSASPATFCGTGPLPQPGNAGPPISGRKEWPRDPGVHKAFALSVVETVPNMGVIKPPCETSGDADSCCRDPLQTSR
jgi:hypothetical protein